MISILSAFWMFVILFGLIGAMRGWAKEMLVVFSVVLALFLVYVLESFTPYLIPFEEIFAKVENYSPNASFESLPGAIQTELRTQFWSRAVIVALLSFFGYQTPKLAVLRDKARQEKIQDALLGAVLGLMTGFFIIGTLWWYMAAAQYPFSPEILPPQPGTPLGDAAINILKYFPPVFASNQIGLFFAVVVAFMFVLVVFI
ncbi:MAG: CvpA family protein [Anaerolineales bacterium]|nr:CvpA family protein [Anaerolineales bacterium]